MNVLRDFSQPDVRCLNTKGCIISCSELHKLVISHPFISTISNTYIIFKFPSITANMVNMSLRTLDFTKFLGSEKERHEFCHAFLDGITEVGFVKLINHGLDEKTNSELFQQVG
jgi:hypothetical protein